MSIYGSLTTSEMLEEVKRRAFLPDAQETLSDDDILAFLNREMEDSVLPLILQYHEEYLVYIEEQTLVTDTTHYKIPYRAIGRKLRDVKYKDTQGNFFPMTRIMPENRAYFQSTGYSTFKAYFFQNDDIVLASGSGNPNTGLLSLAFFMKPNKLVKENRVCSIQSYDANTGVITVDAIPTNIVANSLIDFVEYLPGHKLKDYDVTVTGIDANAKTITINPSDIPQGLVVRDFICTAGESPLPQIPSELHSLLAERGAARCLASLGHSENLQNSNAKIAEMQQNSGALIDNRSEGTPIKVNNINGIVRLSRLGRRRFYF